MTGPWTGGIQVRGLDGGTPVADFLCAVCLDHKRATGRRRVTEFLRDNPVTAHGPHCKPPGRRST
ncbi:transcription factor WhiB [Streptomyces sp. NPDC057257]|uniref:transcription factor WhiB n=1 Tax=Streptomyces sp. NPDC057257 TaxID=3346071 RepID=UPI003631D410